MESEGDQSRPDIKLELLKEKLSTFQSPKEEEPLIESEPSLPYISIAANILRSSEDAEGKSIPHWTKLSSQVKGFDNTLELSDKVRDVIRDYVGKKIADLKLGVPDFAELEDAALLNALTNNWFEEVSEVSGERSKILLTVMANIIKRMETKVYKDVITNADEVGLQKLGIDGSLRNLLVDVLDTNALC